MSHLYLVFDIETTPLDWEEFSESQKEYILRGAESEEEIKQRKFELALNPLSSKIVCIGLQLMEQTEDSSFIEIKKAAFSTKNNFESNKLMDYDLESGHKMFVASESKILEDFWAILEKYKNVILISFNGRAFDAPYLMLRSAKLNIRPKRNLMAGTKFNYPLHIDLADELTFYIPTKNGATRRYNLDFYTNAFGIDSPKSGGVDGTKVRELYQNDEIEIISEYCLRDVTATWDLFLKWNNYLRF